MELLRSDLVKKAREKIAIVDSLSTLESLKAEFLGPNGVIRKASQAVRELSPSERPAFGRQLNTLKDAIESLFVSKAQELSDRNLLSQLPQSLDITLNARDSWRGSIHPLTQVREELETIFHHIGFVTVDGPEVETEWFCFDALNTPPSHPARDAMDTFFLPEDVTMRTTSKHADERYILRSHTSTVQIRTMLKEKPPLRVVSPGRTFRRDTVDATHSANFHQFEALYVDEHVSVCDLYATLDYALKRFFGKNTRTRLRPSFFPFTEPSFEMDFRAQNIGKLSDQWIEVLGCGLVDPNVFEAVGIDPTRYTGFAAGFGIERLAMLRYGIDDVRLFYQNDLRFLDQFAR
ncbi:MAG: phenylalanine--tRNA ligase subunit alpha [Verrucomicrobiota bacterium]|nr:MAG: phenylalanine--tRNA ligase subunit alpha [Verrucomicrobiota bacterium]